MYCMLDGEKQAFTIRVSVLEATQLMVVLGVAVESIAEVIKTVTESDSQARTETARDLMLTAATVKTLIEETMKRMNKP